MGISFKNVTYIYQENTPFEKETLHNINIEIPTGSFTSIIGHTGSGKTTLIQHINGLLRPSKGEVSVNDQIINKSTKNKELIGLRKEVGMVFQFPESQLFAETVIDDVKFGPINFGYDDNKATSLAKNALNKVGINENLWSKSPFELSGGQMRRVAIAGVIAINPKILVLDEPTAGLDPIGHHEMMELFYRLYKNENVSIVLVSHQMDDVAKYSDNIIVMDEGKIIKNDRPRKVFENLKWLHKHQLDTPESVQTYFKLLQNKISLKEIPLTIKELANEIVSFKERKQNNE